MNKKQAIEILKDSVKSVIEDMDSDFQSGVYLDLANYDVVIPFEAAEVIVKTINNDPPKPNQ